MCLGNLEIMMRSLKINPQEFIDNFTSTKFCSDSDMSRLESVFKSMLLPKCQATISSYIDNIISNTNFKAKLHEFFSLISKELLEGVGKITEYNEILKKSFFLNEL